MAGIEPAASCSQSRRAARLHHIPRERSNRRTGCGLGADVYPPLRRATSTGHAAVDSGSLPPLSLSPSPERRYLRAVIVTDNPGPSVHRREMWTVGWVGEQNRIPLPESNRHLLVQSQASCQLDERGNGGDGGNRTPIYGFSVRRLDHVGHISISRVPVDVLLSGDPRV